MKNMEHDHDELMDDIDSSPIIPSFDIFFQFDNDEPMQMATIKDGHRFSITLDSSSVDNPEIIFSDGKGKSFKFFMKCSSSH